MKRRNIPHNLSPSFRRKNWKSDEIKNSTRRLNLLFFYSEIHRLRSWITASFVQSKSYSFKILTNIHRLKQYPNLYHSTYIYIFILETVERQFIPTHYTHPQNYSPINSTNIQFSTIFHSLFRDRRSKGISGGKGKGKGRLAIERRTDRKREGNGTGGRLLTSGRP